MTWLSYIFPQTVLITSSKYNKLIRVNEERGQYKLLVNGSRQSGEYIRHLWDHALNKFGINETLPIRNILVLGVAGGNVIRLLRRTFPTAKITGVDIDPVMIDIGIKYFKIDKIPDFKIVNADAGEFVNSNKSHFDLIIVDIFFGRVSSDLTTQNKFLDKLKSIINPDGRVIINYLRELEYAGKSDRLSDTLKNIFKEVSDARIERNRFFCCRL